MFSLRKGLAESWRRTLRALVGTPAASPDNQPPETAGRIMISSPGTSAVSSPSRSRTWSVFTNKFTCRRTAPVSSQMPPYNEGCRLSSSSRTARTLGAESMSSEAPSQSERSCTRNVDRDVLRSCHCIPNRERRMQSLFFGSDNLPCRSVRADQDEGVAVRLSRPALPVVRRAVAERRIAMAWCDIPRHHPSARPNHGRIARIDGEIHAVTREI